MALEPVKTMAQVVEPALAGLAQPRILQEQPQPAQSLVLGSILMQRAATTV